MGQPAEQPMGRLGIGDVASLLGISVDSLPRDRRQLDTLAELIEALLQKHGEEWIMQHSGVILEQWERLLRLGI